MQKYCNQLLLAPKQDEGGGGSTTTIKDVTGTNLGTLSIDGEENNKLAGDDGDTSANLDGQIKPVDLKDIFGEGEEQKREELGETRVVTDKKKKVVDGVEEETLPPTKEELETKEAEKAKSKVDSKSLTEEQKKIEASKKLYESRDYSNMSDEDVASLKKLPNGIFNYVAPLIRERNLAKAEATKLSTEIKKWTENPNRVPDSWYQNPNAYTLTPEFNTISQAHGRYGTEATHWEQQLVAIENGAKEVTDLGFNPQTGQYFVKGNLPVTGELKVGLTRALMQARQGEQQTQQQALQLQQRFQSTATEHSNYYGEQDKYFSQLPEALRPDDKIAANLTTVLHPFDKETPLGKLCARMYSVIIKQGEALKGKAAKEAIEIRNKQDQRGTGPSTSRGKNGRVASKANDGEDEVNLNELVGELKGES